MEARQWLNALSTQLATAGVPRFYVRRLVTELTEHLEHFMEEEHVMSMEALSSNQISSRLGTADELAELAIREYRQGGFISRHPWLTFLAAPIPMFILAVVLHTIAIIIVASILEGNTVESQPVLMGMFTWFGQSLAFLPSLVVSGLLCFWAHKSHRDWRWQLTGCALVAVMAGMLNVVCSVPTQPGNGQFSVGFGIGWTAFHLLQFAAPLVMAVISIVIQRKRQRAEGASLPEVSS